MPKRPSLFAVRQKHRGNIADRRAYARLALRGHPRHLIPYCERIVPVAMFAHILPLPSIPAGALGIWDICALATASVVGVGLLVLLILFPLLSLVPRRSLTLGYKKKRLPDVLADPSLLAKFTLAPQTLNNFVRKLYSRVGQVVSYLGASHQTSRRIPLSISLRIKGFDQGIL